MPTESSPSRAAESFDSFAHRATGHPPYPYQRRIALEGLPELLKIPTGAGKSMAAVIPWLYRRRLHPEPEIRRRTPHWLVFVLPMRVLVEQTRDAIRGWLDRAGLADDVGLHIVMGAEGRPESLWRAYPERDSIFVGTLDMLISRALNRGYAASRFSWPIDFGLFNAGCQWIFDEIQLMGAALPTSRQLEGLRRQLGTALPCASTWMSATIDERGLHTFDLPKHGTVVELSDEDRQRDLAVRLQAVKTVRKIVAGRDGSAKELAAALVEQHRPGTLTIAVLNTVDRAREVWRVVRDSTTAEVVLLHSRFRPADRAAHVKVALADVDASGPGRIVVSTQVLEAGVDISATTLFTEAAPWPSLVQRAGRCNRDGRADDARLLWASPPKPEPYEEEDIRATEAALIELERSAVTGPDLGARPVPVKQVVHPVLRRVDLLGLFDTTPDLSGNDLDVSRFIRDANDIDVQVAWRALSHTEPPADARPTRDELCPVPIGQLRDVLRGGRGSRPRQAWRFDHLTGRWIRCGQQDVRPAHVLLLDSEAGGYDPTSGWDPGATAPVALVTPDERSPIAGSEEATDDDPNSFAREWVGLRRHLQDAERAARDLAASIDPHGLSPGQIEAACQAARLHDLGKVHPCFQEFLLSTVRDASETPSDDGPWAKSGGTKNVRHRRRHFRHELASALAVLANPSVLAGQPEPDLIAYLVAGHHGRVRLGIRSLPGETRPPNDPDRRVALGVWDGEEIPGVEVPDATLAPTRLDLSPMEMGDGADGQPSWTARALALRDRPDLGPFRLAFLEALVRLADWRVSAPRSGPRP